MTQRFRYGEVTVESIIRILKIPGLTVDPVEQSFSERHAFLADRRVMIGDKVMITIMMELDGM
jgi:hypothetical protein